MSKTFDALEDANSPDEVLDKLEGAALAYAAAANYESQMEDQRALVKVAAILRLMAAENLAATNAEKRVEADALYAEHRAKQREAVVATMLARARFKAMEARATRWAETGTL